MPELPHHIAIVMDGNGRWAEQRKRPRTMGHQAGLRALRGTVEHCVRTGIDVLTVFAFSSENWERPQREVARLMDLFMRALDKEVSLLHENGVRVCFIGAREAFQPELQERMRQAEKLTAGNVGGRWDVVQATRKLAAAAARGDLAADDIDHDLFDAALSTHRCKDPDLFIRTGGEMRISNFLLWQSAYTEFYFTPTLWPDFDAAELDRAIAAFQSRERRFGKTGSQVKGRASA